MTTTEFLNKYDSGENFEEREIMDAFWGDFDDYKERKFQVIEEEEGDDRRWTRAIYRYVKIQDRYFLIQYDRGLTEMQEDYWDWQPEEMSLKVVTKTIQVNEWTAIERND